MQYSTLFTHATSRSDKNSLKHVLESKNDKKERKSNKLKLPFHKDLSNMKITSNNFAMYTI